MHRILLDATSQTLSHSPPGYVSAATFALEDLTYSIGDASRTLASGSCSVASWTLTTSASAGPTASNGQRIMVTATTGATVGSPAVITATDGTRELLEVAAVSSGVYLEALTTLADTYASGSNVRGIGLTAAIPDAVAARDELFEQERPIRIVWSYTLGSAVYRAQHVVEFARHTGTELADVAAIQRSISVLYPDLQSRLGDGSRWSDLVAELARGVRVDLRAHEIEPSRYLASEAGHDLMLLRVVDHAAQLGWAPGSWDLVEFSTRARRAYRDQLDAITHGTAGLGVVSTRRVTDTAPAGADQTYQSPFRKS